MSTKNLQRRLTALVVGCLTVAFWMTSAQADPGFAEHRIVIQVSTDDPRTQTIALNNAANLQQAFGVDNVAVEIVAYGPGLSLLTQGHAQAKRIQGMAMQGVQFSACANTIAGITRKSGKKPQLNEAATVVPAGVGRILELQEQGYAYIRP